MDIELFAHFSIVLIIIFSTFGFLFFDFALEVNPEYINGILTASSIIFGLWGFVITRTEKGMNGYFWKFHIRKVFAASFLILAFSVFFVYLSGLSEIHSAYALYISINIFLWNAYAMIVTLFATSLQYHKQESNNRIY